MNNGQLNVKQRIPGSMAGFGLQLPTLDLTQSFDFEHIHDEVDGIISVRGNKLFDKVAEYRIGTDVHNGMARVDTIVMVEVTNISYRHIAVSYGDEKRAWNTLFWKENIETRAEL